MPVRIEIPIGTRFGRLVVIENNRRVIWSDGKERWGCLLKCECGGLRELPNGVITNKPPKYCSQDCGFRWTSNDKGLNLKGGFPGWYRSYNAMKQRCSSSAVGHSKANYYERGIRVCEEWLKDPWAFFAHMGDRPEGMTLDRIDVNGNYEPGNCRWATHNEQAQNKRTNRTRATSA